MIIINMERIPEEESKYKVEFRRYLEREFGITDRRKQDVAIALFDETFLQKAREVGILPLEPRELLYQMKVADEEHWFPIRQAGIIYDAGWIDVRIGGVVLEGLGYRPITDEERAQIAEIADEYSASK